VLLPLSLPVYKLALTLAYSADKPFTSSSAPFAIEVVTEVVAEVEVGIDAGAPK
jgi:hypothetical protein